MSNEELLKEYTRAVLDVKYWTLVSMDTKDVQSRSAEHMIQQSTERRDEFARRILARML